jgi:C1q domain
MAIPSRQIGWGTEENLLWEISKQLEALIGVSYKAGSIQVPSSNIVTAKLATNQTVSSSDVAINFTSVNDPQGWFNNSTHKFTPTIAGYYNISYSVLWGIGTVTAGQQMNTQIHFNGSTQLYISQSIINTAVNFTQSGSVIVYLNGTTDYITITGYSSSTSGSQTVQSGAGTLFNASLI